MKPYAIVVAHLLAGPPCPLCPGVSPHRRRFVVEWYGPRGTVTTALLVAAVYIVGLLAGWILAIAVSRLPPR